MGQGFGERRIRPSPGIIIQAVRSRRTRPRGRARCCSKRQPERGPTASACVDRPKWIGDPQILIWGMGGSRSRAAASYSSVARLRGAGFLALTGCTWPIQCPEEPKKKRRPHAGAPLVTPLAKCVIWCCKGRTRESSRRSAVRRGASHRTSFGARPSEHSPPWSLPCSTSLSSHPYSRPTMLQC